MKKREKSISYNLDKAVVDVWKREVGQISGRTFARRIAASEDFVQRLDLHSKLKYHTGTFESVGFSPDGGILVLGSHDCRVTLWDWQFAHEKLSFHTGHLFNILQAKIMPFSDERSIVTCASEGQLRHAQILECGHAETKLLTEEIVHKLAVEHGSPHILYTCGRDGLVQHFDLRTGAATKLFTCKSLRRDLYMPNLHLNDIAIDPRNCNLFAIAGVDQYARLYDIRKFKRDGSSKFGLPADYFCPEHLIGYKVGITGLEFSDQSELLATYGHDCIYLFAKGTGLGPVPDLSSPKFIDINDAGEVKFDHIASESSLNNNSYIKDSPQVYKGHKNSITIKGAKFFGPRCEYVVSGSGCGRIFIWRKRSGELLRVMKDDVIGVEDVAPHPHTTVLASNGMLGDIKLWIPKASERATLKVPFAD